jgi:hypothetical protein
MNKHKAICSVNCGMPYLVQAILQKTILVELYFNILAANEYRKYIGRNENGRAMAQAVNRWFPTAAARVRARIWSCEILWWTKWRWGRFSPSTSVSPVNLHSTNCSTIILIYHLDLYNRPEVAAVSRDLVPPHQKKILEEKSNNFLMM